MGNLVIKDTLTSYGEASHSASLFISNNISVQMQVKLPLLSTIPADDSSHWLLGKYWSEGWLILYKRKTDETVILSGGIGGDGWSSWQDMNSSNDSSAFFDGEYHQVGFVRDGTIVNFYIDNTLVNTISGVTDDISNTQALRINSNDFNRKCPCSLDNIQVWNRALSGVEIELYHDGCIGTESGLVAYYNCDEGSGEILNDLTSNSNDMTLYDVAWDDWVESLQDPPIAPVVSELTMRTVVLISDEGSMIVCNSEEKVSGSTWDWLEPTVSYNAYAYMPASEGVPASDISGITDFTTLSEYIQPKVYLSGVMSDGTKATRELLQSAILTANNDNVKIVDNQILLVKKGTTTITITAVDKTTTMEINIV